MNGSLGKSGQNGGGLMLITGIVLFIFMLSSLLMMSNALQNSEHFGEYYSGLLIFNTLGLVVLVGLILANLRNLIRQLKNKVPGARMTFRTVIMFAFLSVTPVLIVYYFSLDFLHRGIDSWFDVKVEKALDDSLELSRLSLEEREQDILKKTKQIANDFSQISNVAVPFEIDDYRTRLGARELTLMTRQGRFIASSTGDISDLVPNRPNNAILFQVQQGNNYIGLDTIQNGELSIRAVVNVPNMGVESKPRIIQVLFPITGRINELANNIQSAYIKYNELSFLRDQLKFGFVVILTLVVLFSIFSAVWAAFYSAQKLAAPIRNLAEGTKSVAEGDYSKQLPVPGNDELGFLVASFNEMTRRIANARDAVRKSQLEAEAQRAYLEAVIGRLSSGVLVLDQDNRLRTVNISTGQILGTDLNRRLGDRLEDILADYRYLEPLIKTIASYQDSNEGEWREQVTLFGTSGRQILMCSGTSLSLSGLEDSLVHVIVFDDITALIQGQRDAAWSEMARRLAHEIKNPLTPIQLAAERLRHKYLDTLKVAQPETMDRLTNTIIHQVETMKDMVNTFSEYARPPVISRQMVDLNELIREVVDLFINLDPGASITLNLSTDLPRINADLDRLRRVFNNLLKNAFDASTSEKAVALVIETHHIDERGRDFIEVRIKDSGTGLSGDIISNVFEPYVTSKKKGSGLGLAIVKKIIEEHGGVVWLENNPDGIGACAVIRLPVTEADSSTNIGNVMQKDVI
jgi:nitrogen fixation/metabolism regulation signal transduction histidine kinase